ncbi:L-threonylcarbamoyladenylate synthase [Schaalia sp. lx-100]|uniref:L-threonylcarbamoyladenylate synthase n=1 Tax=Schaalia sp. lx-100 TaxID=2899081 RepID=UPI001E3073E9|nr:L-threonylcarbamoyladenylate synthase [Schaalia sp. lx-100]MCD4556715.1 threonylcarbamoyl-AMP synthase [Schaalia sp. lx-100]
MRIIDSSAQWDEDVRDSIAAEITQGELIVIPTDTVYGIGCRADDPHAVTRLLAAKGRGHHMPPPVLIADPSDIQRIGTNVTDVAITLAQNFWPGALTLIVQAQPELGWNLGQTRGTVALRMPDLPLMCDLLRVTGPLAVTSANLTGQEPATTITRACEYFGEKVATYIDGGPSGLAIPSTILDVTEETLRPIREGAISLEQIMEVLQG